MAEWNPNLIRSRWRAYDPNGRFKEVVTLTREAKLRYEAKGWTFQRADRKVWEGNSRQ